MSLYADEPPTAQVPHLYQRFMNGKDARPADDDAAAAVLSVAPMAVEIAKNNRSFMLRAVDYLASEAGIRQFLDIGCGLPHEPNLHHVAQKHIPDARIVYVDNHRTVITRARALMTDSTPEGTVEVVKADLRDPRGILSAPEVQRTLDFTQPVALVLASVTLFIPDADDPHGAVRQLMEALPSGSYLALSQATYDWSRDVVAAITRTYGANGLGAYPRDREATLAFFSSLELVEPGLVATNQWRPTPEAPFTRLVDSSMWAGVGRKP
ncbi:SAM-dependent methyltransferase [Streptomyces sp. XD-27]|uniref:SAM-dependent methyltransferase n=1 Tax=Streptomyces sp. XD-27 TaxID=3062779 RepID=UPI0026F43765|nr:SAM-dependent methyltransferase [Streptomyces sp. XD-27]WKX70066.1 SAM-dependent methyltransferase [Streptomyces sp. XD-27]